MSKSPYLVSVLALSVLISACAPGFESGPDDENSDRNRDRDQSRKKDDEDQEKKIEPVADDQLWRVVFNLRTNFTEFDQKKTVIAATFKSLTDAQVSTVLKDSAPRYKVQCDPGILRLWELNDSRLNRELETFWETRTLSQDESAKPRLTADFIVSHPFRSVNFNYRTDMNREFLETLSQSKALSSLSFYASSALDDDALKEIAKISTLTELNLGYSANPNKLTDKGIQNLSRLDKLRKLSLANTKITDATLDTLLNFTLLEDLDLTYTGTNGEAAGITPDGIRKLKSLKSLQKLNLSSTIGTKKDVSYIPAFDRSFFVNSVLELDQIRYLTLTNNLLTAEQGKILAEKATHIEVLDLSSNRMATVPTGPFGLEKPARSDIAVLALAKNTTLKELDLRNNGFSGDALKKLAENNTLEFLTVSEKEVDLATREALTARFKDNVKFSR